MSCINVAAGISLQNTVNLYRIGHFYFAKTGHYYIALTGLFEYLVDYVSIQMLFIVDWHPKWGG
jgi:hypothetical protein